MTHYVVVEEEEGKAVGVWFPDLPGCISAGEREAAEWVGQFDRGHSG